MEDKSAIIISLTDAFKLKSDLIDIGYSTSIVSSYSKLPYCGKNEKQPDLIIAEVEFCSDIDFIQRKGELLSHFSSSPIIFLLDKVFANDLTQKGLLKKTGYITPDYSLRELELCIDTLPSHSKELKTPNIWVDQANLTTIFNILPNGILICDKDGNIQSVNDAFTEILGYSREELCSMNIRGFTLTETHVLIEQNIRKILNGETIHTEVINICKDGSFKNLELVEKRITLSNGETGVLSIATDVTYWKEINNSLKESEEKYRILVEKSNDGIIFSQGEILVYANPKINEMIGYSHDEIIGQPFHFFLHPDERERIIEKYQRRKLGDNAPEIYETLLQKKNGESLSVEFNVNMATYKGKPATMVFIRDITQRKVSEKFLKESEESYRSVFDNASEAIYIQDANGVFLDVNKAASNLYGYPKSEIIGYTPEKLSAPGRNDMTDAVRRLKEAFEGKSQIFEFWGLTKAGREFPKEVVLNKGKYFGKDVVFAMARDISERKNAEAILMESEEKYRTLAEQIPVGIYRTSESGTFYYANPALAQILGFEKVDDLLTHNVNEFFANSQERLEVLKLYKKSNDYVQSEFAMIRIDGKQIWIRDNGKANYDSKGNITFFDGVVENITLQREANEALKKSEANLRATLNAIPDLMFRFNREGVYLDLHSYNKNDLVIDSSRILGNSIKDFFTEEFSNTIIVNINKCIDTGSLQTFEYEVPLKGEVNHFEARMIPVGANEVLVFSRNITDKKRAEEKINMLAQTIINIVESVSITDIGNRIIYVNPAFLEMYGYTEEEIIGQNISIIRPKSLPQELPDEIFNTTIGGGWQGELLNVRKNGQEFPISLSTAIVKDNKGTPIAFVGVASDITERKIAEQELVMAKEKAEESDRLKTAFLANMSHEIRSPMNAILGFIRIIKDEEKLTENGKQYIELISNSGAQLVSVIEDILDTSKIQANQLRLNIHEFELNNLLTNLYTIYSTQVREKHKMSTIMLPPVLSHPSPFMVFSDDMRIRQILTNLISNAIKFTSKGLIEFGYSLFVDDDNPLIQFYVKDTGIGLSPDALNLIFERFRQADDSYTRMYGGSGLGLAISKGLTELLGGRIWVESVVGKGSTFYFTIPIKAPIDKNQTDLDEELTSNQIKFIDGLNWSDKTLFIVEDLPDIRFLLQRILAKTGAKIVFAASLKEAREVFKRIKNIDLILLDIRLPDGDGYELSAEFKAKRPKVPIIAQTAYAMQGEREKSIEFGCDDFITKPLNHDLLFMKINAFLNGKN
ncbi:MAG TPA: hypothetical protein DIW31_03565 [Bacteroidales bacterium]|nr:hypothetical protein [Bacteroidales bacterium]